MYVPSHLCVPVVCRVLQDIVLAALSAPLASISTLECQGMRRLSMAPQIILLYRATIFHWMLKSSQVDTLILVPLYSLLDLILKL